VPNLVNTNPAGLPIVLVLLPANSNATGFLPELLTIREPESPPALNVLLLITTWFV
jgi:hypothetical protein